MEVLGATAPTFMVAGHHYALVHVTGLTPGAAHAYEVRLEGRRRWPEDGSRFPPPTIRTPRAGEAVRVAFGSCRLAVPQVPPYTLTKDEDPLGAGHDALRALAGRMIDEPPERWPDVVVMLGDQVYADEGSPRVRELIRTRRDPERPPGLGVADFEEYTRLYRESWSEPTIRWLLSTVPSAMIFDDHEVSDDWNISESWVRDAWREPWWEERLAAAYMSYWIYQHVGNLAPEDLADDPLWREVRAAGDAEGVLRSFAAHTSRTPDGSRWSYWRELNGVRLVVVDSRAGRVVRDGRRSMLDDEEWRWVRDRVRGDVDHLLVASSLPVFLAPGMHGLEAWSEAVCAGAWGSAAARLGERLRRGLDLEHWAAFGASFAAMVDLLRAVGAGERGRPPATVVVISGDVHHAYLAQVGFPPGAGVRSRVYQVVCSPFRNPLDARERRVIRFGASRAAARIGRLLARAAGVCAPAARWRLTAPPVFDNQVATFTAAGPRATLRVEKTVPHEDAAVLETTLERRLA